VEISGEFKALPSLYAQGKGPKFRLTGSNEGFHLGSRWFGGEKYLLFREMEFGFSGVQLAASCYTD